MQNYENIKVAYANAIATPVDINLVQLCMGKHYEMVQTTSVLCQYKFLQQSNCRGEAYKVFNEYLSNVTSADFVKRLEVI